MKSKPPFLLYLLGLIAFAASFYYFSETVQAVRSWNLLAIMQYRLGPIYPVFQGALLGSAFLFGGIILLMRLAWAPAFNANLLSAAVVWFWLDRTVLSLNPLPFSQQIFPICATVLLLSLLIGALWSLQPNMLSSKAEAIEDPFAASLSEENDEHEPS